MTALEHRTNTGISAPATFQAAASLRKVTVPALRIRLFPARVCAWKFRLVTAPRAPCF